MSHDTPSGPIPGYEQAFAEIMDKTREAIGFALIVTSTTLNEREQETCDAGANMAIAMTIEWLVAHDLLSIGPTP